MKERTKELIAHVDKAIECAHLGVSKIDLESLKIGGFSTPFQRRLMNNLCSDPVDCYLEVGLFRGGTFCSASCNNRNLVSYGVEDFSQPFGEGGVKEDLLKNIELARQKTKQINLVNEDCWTWKKPQEVVDVLFYDGEHSLESQSRAIPHFLSALKPSSIIVVDDYSWPDVNTGTRNGFDLLQKKLEKVKEYVFHVTQNEHVEFHNGLAVFVVEKLS